jgi:hypothetical protein
VEFEVTFTVTVKHPRTLTRTKKEPKAIGSTGRTRESSGVDVGGGQGWKML